MRRFNSRRAAHVTPPPRLIIIGTMHDVVLDPVSPAQNTRAREALASSAVPPVYMNLAATACVRTPWTPTRSLRCAPPHTPHAPR